MSDDDWKTIRAARWRAAQRKQQNSSTASRSTAAAEASVAGAHQTNAWTPEPAALNSAGCKKASFTPPAGLHAAVIGLVVMLLGMAVHNKVQLLCENSGLNQGDMPDARMRPAYSHRDYILNKLDFVHVYSSRQREATAAEQLASNWLSGQAWGMWGAESEVFKAGITRCATTQYAMTTYFCGKAMADQDQQLPSIQSAANLRNYIRLIDDIVQNPEDNTCTLWPELVLRFHLSEKTDGSVGHTFVIHFLPEGGAQVYQSFITHYTLHMHLTSHGPLDASGLDKFITNMEIITNATTWGRHEDAAYKANFLVSLAKGNKVAVGKADPNTPIWELPCSSSDNTPGAIKVYAEPVCLVVPWEAPEDIDDYAGGLLPPVVGTEAASGAGQGTSQRGAPQQGALQQGAEADYDEFLEDYLDEVMQPEAGGEGEGAAEYEPQQYPFEWNEGDLVFD